MNRCIKRLLTMPTPMEKADGRALETQLNRLPHTQKTVYQPTIFSLLNLRWFPSLIAGQTSHVAVIVLVHKLKNWAKSISLQYTKAKC
jgi:hypothetical protein